MAKSPAAILYDALGQHPVGVVVDDVVYRLQADAKVAKNKFGALQHLSVLESGSLVTTGSSVPVDSPAQITNAFVLNNGSSDLRVNGSVTPVIFTYNADPTYDIRLISLDLAIVGAAINFTGAAFGPLQSALTNGVKVDLTAENGQTATIGLFKISEELLHFASAGGFQWVVAANDVLVSQLNIGGALTLVHGTADKVTVTIQDNLTSSLFKYFRLFVKGIKEVG